MPLDSIAVLSPLDRATDANGNPVPGAKLRFYEAGTSTPKTVYSDSALTQSLGSTVTCDAGGYPTSDGSTQVSIYVGSDAYKLVVTTSADVTVHTRDNLKGAPEIPDVASTALPNTPVVSKTSTYTILSTDQGKLIQADPTGGSFALTLPSAITVGDNFRVGVRHNGASTSNVVGVRATGGQTVGAPGQASATSISLVGYGQTIWLVSNGADWVIDGTAEPLMMGGLPFFKITDRLTAPPVSPTGGNRYIVNGTPTGVWLTLGFAEDDIAEADGNGSWLKYSPAAGFFAYVADEDLFTKFDGTSWEDQTGMGAADSSTLKTAVYEHQVTQNNGGGTNTNGSWATRPLTTEVVDSIGMSVSSNEITVPVGTYLVVAQQQLFHQAGTLGSTGIAQQRLTAVTATFDALSLGMPTRNGGVASGSGITFDSYHTHALHDIYLLHVTVAGTIKLEYKVNFQTSTNGLGYPANNGTEVYARVAFLSLTSLQGATGPQGIQGNDGLDAAYYFQWNTATAGNPGSGKCLVNHATFASATTWSISETDANGGILAGVIASWDDSSSTSSKARVRIQKESATQNYVEFYITGAGTDLGSYWTFPIIPIGADGTLGNGNDLAVLVIPTGDIGDPGTTVPNISGLTEDTENDDEADFLIAYDTSASSHKKVKPKNLGYTGGGGLLRPLRGRLDDQISLLNFIPRSLHSDIRAFVETSDVSSYVQDALDYALLKKRAIWAPAGLYMIENTLTAYRADPITPNGLKIEGEGGDQTIFKTDTATGSLLVAGNDDDSDITQSRFVDFKGFSLIGPNRDQWAAYNGYDGSDFIAGQGIRLRGIAWAHLNDVYIEGFNTGLDSRGCLTSLLESLELRYNVQGLNVVGNSASDANAITLLNMSIGSNRDFGVTATEVSLLKAIGGTIEGNGYGAINGYGLKTIDAGKAGRVGVFLDGVWFESNKGDADFYVVNTNYPATYAARDCSFHRLDGSNYTTNNIRVEATVSTFRMHLSGNAFWSGGSYSENASRKQISTSGSSGDYEIVHGNSNYFMGSTEVPTRGDLSASTPYPGVAASVVFHPQLRSSVLDAVAVGQLPFPATQNASADANTLDDYEEGSWTPTLTFATPGDQSIAYTLRTGVYTKIGRVVHIQFTIVTSTFTHTTAAGNLSVTGLPFAAGSALHRGTLDFGGINAAGYTQVTVAVGGGGSTLVFNKSGMGVAVGTVAAADAPTGGTVALVGSATYFV